MTDAKRDNNSVPVMLAASNADGKTPLPVRLDPSTHQIQISDAATGTDLSNANDRRDNNMVPFLIGVSSSDGSTPTMAYIDSATNNLLVKST